MQSSADDVDVDEGKMPDMEKAIGAIPPDEPAGPPVQSTNRLMDAAADDDEDEDKDGG